MTQLENNITAYEGAPKGQDPGHVYLDNKQNPTIGIGHNLSANSDGGNIVNILPGTNYQELLSGQQTLTPQQIQVLFNYDLKAKIDMALTEFPDLTAYPEEVQFVIIDLTFNGGRWWEKFPKAAKAIKGHDYAKAAYELGHNDKGGKSQYLHPKGNKNDNRRAVDNISRLNVAAEAAAVAAGAAAAADGAVKLLSLPIKP